MRSLSGKWDKIPTTDSEFQKETLLPRYSCVCLGHVLQECFIVGYRL